MSGTFPSDPIPATVDISSLQETFVSVTQSGRRNVRKTGSQRWRLNATYANLTRAQFMPVFAFLMDQDGQFESFQFVPPDLATPRGTAGGTPQVNGASQTGKSVVTNGWNNSETVLRAGDVFKFTNSAKVYMVTQDCTSDGTGNATINFAPEMIESPLSGELLVVTNVPFTVQQTNKVQKYGARNPLLYNFEVSFVEVI